MRLLIHLTAKDSVIPINYNYFLSIAIYKILQFGSPDFSEFLHSKGYVLNGKMYKLFSFALEFNSMIIENHSINLLSPEAKLYITSPMVDDFLQNFVLGSFHNQALVIAFGISSVRFEIKQIETLPEPVFDKINYFKPLSPIVLSTRRFWKNKETQYFYRYSDNINHINLAFNINLKNKYELIYKKPFNGPDVLFAWDENFIAERISSKKRLTKKVSILKRGIQPIDIIANKIPFALTGSNELIKVGYDCGFGEKNSMGFGLAVLTSNN